MSLSRCFLPFKVFGKLFNIAFFKHGRNRLLAQAETNFCLPADFGHFQTGLAVRFVHPPVTATKWENLSVGHEIGGWKTSATYQWEQMSSTVALLIGSTSSMCRIKGEAAAPVDNNRRHERGAQKRRIQREEAVNQQEFH